jgi:hypothetical protein
MIAMLSAVAFCGDARNLRGRTLAAIGRLSPPAAGTLYCRVEFA